MPGAVKESLFSIISDHIPESSVLDLFAGSGSLAIEALSRGAGRAVLVEHDRVAAQFCRENLVHTGFEGAATVIRGRIPGILGRVAGAFGLVFVDPPYRQALVLPTLRALLQQDMVLAGGLVVVHVPAEEELYQELENLQVVDQRIYGQSKLYFYRGTGRGEGDEGL